MVFREGRSQGVHRMIATHAMDLAGQMNMDQMLEAAKEILRQIVIPKVGNSAEVRDERAIVGRAQYDGCAGGTR